MKISPAVCLAVVSALFSSTSVFGAAGVVEAAPRQGSSGALTSSAAGQGASNDALVMLLDQFQAMRGELEFLRNLVEEQGFELSRLQRDSLDRYTDLDARISALYQDMADPRQAAPVQTPPAAVGNPAQSPAVQTPRNDTPIQSNPAPAQGAALQNPAPAAITPAAQIQTPATPTIQPHLMTEQQLYQLALDSLLQEEQYQKSIAEFDQYLALYPNGRFVTNAYYWKGQAFVNLSQFNDARDAFETIVRQYPDGRKVDDAMYSLGTVYDRLGNSAQARELLNQVKSRFPNTSAANLADIYLRSM